MTPEEKATQEAATAEQDKKDADAKAKADADAAKAEEGKRGKMGEIYKKEGGKTVPEAVFLQQKADLKAAQAEIEKLKTAGATPKEITASLKEIADKFDVDPDLISSIANLVKSETAADVEQKLKPIEEEKQRVQIDKIFKEHYTKALEQMPEYKGVANEAVVKSLSLDPANKDKSFAQILEESYGHLVKATKKPIENVRPKDGGGASEVTIDFERARKDGEYFKEIMADPQTKAEYNKALAKRLKL